MDRINPDHYKSRCGRFEAIDVIDGFDLNTDYNLATAVAYILRCKRKDDALTDLRKADRAIAKRQDAS